MTDLPAPLIGPEVDLRDFTFTPIYRARLFGSAFHAHNNDAEWRAGVTLWLKSWDQAPAGSLPDDEVDLCRLAELGRDMKAWRRVREGALHGWFKCSDGRLYHNVVAAGVRDAWQRKQGQRDRTAKAREARLSKNSDSQHGGNVTDTVTSSVTEPVTGSKGQGQGQGQGQGSSSEANASGAAAPLDLKAIVFGKGLAWLAKNSEKTADSLRSLLGRWCRDHGEAAVIDAIGAAQRAGAIEPVSWIEKRFAEAGKRPNGAPTRKLSVAERIAENDRAAARQN